MPPARRVALALPLLFAACPATAQTAPPAPPGRVTPELASPEPVTLDTVQVLATRSARPVREVAASVSVVEGNDLAPPTADPGLASRLRGVPGVLARNRHNHAQDEQLSIRGFGTRASFGIRGVRLYVDGIPATMPDGQGQLSHFPLLDAQRIEVLRGPFSALYGNAAGGVLQLFTVDGVTPMEVRVETAGGSAGNRRGGVEMRDRQGAIDYVLGLNHFATDGYRDHSSAERTVFNGKVNFTRGGTRVTLVANALSAPDVQDPLGLDRAQFESDPR